MVVLILLPALVLLPTSYGLATNVFLPGGGAVRLDWLPASDVTAIGISTDGEHVGVLDQAGKRATLYRITDGGAERVGVPLALPKRVTGDALALRGPVIYVATRGRRPAIFALVDGAWVARTLPNAEWSHGRRTCALFVSDDRLIALEVAISARYFVTCPIAADGTLGEATVRGLPVRSVRDRVRLAAFGERWGAVLSGDIRGPRASEHLALFDRRSLTERACLSRLVHHAPEPEQAPIDLSYAEMLAHLDATYAFERRPRSRAGDDAVLTGSTRGDALGAEAAGVDAAWRRSQAAIRRQEPSSPHSVGSKASWTGLAFAREDRLYLGWGVEGIGVLRLCGYSPSDLSVGRREARAQTDWVMTAPVPMTRLKLEAPVEGVVTVPGERGCFALFGDGRHRWVEADEFEERGERFDTGADIGF